MAWMVSQLTPRPSPPLVFCGCTGSSRLHNHGNTAPGRLSSSEPLVDKPEKTRSICKIVKNSQTHAGSERHERGINNDRIFIFARAFPLTQKQSTAVVIEWQMTRAKTRRDWKIPDDFYAILQMIGSSFSPPNQDGECHKCWCSFMNKCLRPSNNYYNGDASRTGRLLVHKCWKSCRKIRLSNDFRWFLPLKIRVGRVIRHTAGQRCVSGTIRTLNVNDGIIQVSTCHYYQSQLTQAAWYSITPHEWYTARKTHQNSIVKKANKWDVFIIQIINRNSKFCLLISCLSSIVLEDRAKICLDHKDRNQK